METGRERRQSVADYVRYHRLRGLHRSVYPRCEIVDEEASLWPYAGPGHWNDADMLEVGNPGLTRTESKSHFSLWCMLAAPLIAGNDLRHMPPAIREILTNKEVVAVDQDMLGNQSQRYRQYPNQTEVWRKELAGNSEAYLLLNRSETPKEISVYIGKTVRVRDLWNLEDFGSIADGFFVRRWCPTTWRW